VQQDQFRLKIPRQSAAAPAQRSEKSTGVRILARNFMTEPFSSDRVPYPQAGCLAAIQNLLHQKRLVLKSGASDRSRGVSRVCCNSTTR
jgi:hypothetical protein